MCVCAVRCGASVKNVAGAEKVHGAHPIISHFAVQHAAAAQLPRCALLGYLPYPCWRQGVETALQEATANP